MTGSCSRRVVAAILLLCWIAGIVAPVEVSAHADRDAACDEPTWTVSHEDLALSADLAETGAGEHCGLCHLQRAMRDVVGAADGVALAAPATMAPRDRALRSARAVLRTGDSSRAPPAPAS